MLYVGVRKTAAPAAHNANRLYARVFVEAIKRIDGHCGEDLDPPEEFVLILDEQRSVLLTEAAKSMYGRTERRRRLIEPPFHLEVIAIRQFRRRTGSPVWWDGWERSGPIRRHGPRTRRSAGISERRRA